ncbi:hypothetical protein Hamer_G014576 [Homarus americanus]|uniref:Uncharacterized protein n=1 Tax=Homarus americanus TaxID=6706 RepID=A0A8J5TJS6_HOMAM|nr:hypothetical protein Hamer_G014576 [Homarus americanus]
MDKKDGNIDQLCNDEVYVCMYVLHLKWAFR